MVLIPAEQAAQAFPVALQMPGQEFPATVQTQGTGTSRLDSDMSAILHSLEFKNDREKWQRYEQALQRFLSLKHLQDRPVATPEKNATKSKNSDQDEEHERKQSDVNKLVQTLPKSYRVKGRKLLNFCLNSSQIDWEPEGRVKIDGSVIPGSNIVELVKDAVKPRRGKKVDAPVGRAQFVGTLKRVKVPTEAIGNKSFWRDDNDVLNSSDLEVTPRTSKILSSSIYESPSGTIQSGKGIENPKRTWIPW